jgi:hypothetical protein
VALTLSMRRLWEPYRDTMVKDGANKDEIALANDAFDCGSRSVLMVLDCLKKQGGTDELNETIPRFDKQITSIRMRKLPRQH